MSTNDLFDYDADLDEILRETTDANQTNNDSSNHNNNTSGISQNPADSGNNRGRTGIGREGGDLGLDEEVKVTRKRAPVAKLDENKLLSQNGIPKLRRTAKTKLKLKGKGHEFSDASRLLTFYQLWLDDLYPRAKFADALSIVEKLGHSKRMQVMRREWIEEGKPNAQRRDHDVDMDLDGGRDGDVQRREDVDESEGVGQNERPVGDDGDGDGDEELFVGGGTEPSNAIPSSGEETSGANAEPPSLFGDGRHISSNNVPDEEDDLEALLAET